MNETQSRINAVHEALAYAVADVEAELARTTFSVSECPDCGAGSGEPCVWACSSNWGQ